MAQKKGAKKSAAKKSAAKKGAKKAASKRGASTSKQGDTENLAVNESGPDTLPGASPAIIKGFEDATE